MNTSDIKPGVRIRCIHGDDQLVLTIATVLGTADTSPVMLRMDGPAGSCLLERKFGTLRDHFLPAD